MARETYLEAIAAAMFAGRLGVGPDVRDVAEAARARRRRRSRARVDLLLDGLVTRSPRATRRPWRHFAGARRVPGDADGARQDRRWLWLACRLAQDLWDDELWYALATRGVRLARETGALSLLPIAAQLPRRPPRPFGESSPRPRR